MKLIKLTRFLYPSEMGKWYNGPEYCTILVNPNTIVKMYTRPHDSGCDNSTVIVFLNNTDIEVTETLSDIMILINS